MVYTPGKSCLPLLLDKVVLVGKLNPLADPRFLRGGLQLPRGYTPRGSIPYPLTYTLSPARYHAPTPVPYAPWKGHGTREPRQNDTSVKTLLSCTRMHSSRMRTICCSSHLLGGVCPGRYLSRGCHGQNS